MISFWVAAAVLAAAAAALMLHRAARGARTAEAPNPQMDVYRQALSEIDALADRDLVAESERREFRAEAARRLLAAADRPSPAAKASDGRWPLAAAALTALVAAGLYLLIGSPNLPDQPFAQRLAAWRTHPESAPPAGLAAVLDSIAAERPQDPTPLRKMAALDLGLGDADGAVHALRRALVLEPHDADLAAMLGEVKVMQHNGEVTPDAHALFRLALSEDPEQDAARYYLARAHIADGDAAGGLAQWRSLLASLPTADPRRAALVSDIAAVERTGRLPAAADASTPADLSGAIRGMVDGLAARLQAHPDDPAGWVRLVRAYGVLGDEPARDHALAAARARYAGQPAELEALAAAARATPPSPGGTP